MPKFTTSAPTRRECVLLALLLLALLSLSRAGISVQESRSSRLVSEKTGTKHGFKLDSVLEDDYVPTIDSERWRTRITWTSEEDVPSTKVVAHVPGAQRRS